MLYISNFLVLTNQEEVQEQDRRHGEFNLLVEAPNTESALTLFKERILQYRKDSDFFEGECKVFLVQLLELDGLPQNRSMMLTYKSTVGDPLLPYIGCLVPNEQTDSCRIFQWQSNQPDIDGIDEDLFVTFQAESV
jgi:hypothetical protein